METLGHLNQYETELQKQTETQEKLYNEVQDLDQKLKEDKEDFEDLKTEFSNVPMKIKNFGADKENLIGENSNMETELEKIDEELKKIKLDNKPILQRKEQLEQELKDMLSEICEDSTACGMEMSFETFFELFCENEYFFNDFFAIFFVFCGFRAFSKVFCSPNRTRCILQEMIKETEKQIGQYLEKSKKLEEDKKQQGN